MPQSPRSKRAFQDALSALAELESAGYEARLAGGCVRDRQMQRIPKDYDIATTATPKEVTLTFNKLGRKIVPTGVEHGTVTLVMPSGAIEITTLRRDVTTDGRRAQVVFGNSFEEDAARRDFTINAMFEDKDGRIYDYHNGLKHLAQKLLCFVGDPSKRIQEDYLRILRFFRFWARFDFAADPEALKVIATLREGLKIVSQERITSELLQILGTHHPVKPLEAMQATGIFSLILPEAKDPIPAEQLNASDAIALAWRPLTRLALLLPEAVGDKKISALCGRLRLSNKQKAIILALRCEFKPQDIQNDDDAGLMHKIDHWEQMTGVGMLGTLILPTWRLLYPQQEKLIARIGKCEEQFGLLRQTPLPLSGDDLAQALGLGPGPKVGKILEALKRDFRNRKWSTRAEGLARAGTILQGLS